MTVKKEVTNVKKLSFLEEVLKAQKSLNKIGFTKLKENGLLNDETKVAIRDFKTLMGIDDDYIDSNLWFIIKEILTWDGKDSTRTFAKTYDLWIKTKNITDK